MKQFIYLFFGLTILPLLSSAAAIDAVSGDKFAAGDRVQTTKKLNIRACASTSCSSLGNQQTGALGSVVRGPKSGTGGIFWNIDYDIGADGWSLENWLENEVESDTTAPSVPAALTPISVTSSQIDLSWDASTDPVVSGQTSSGVVSYNVYRDSVLIATVPVTSYSDVGLPASIYSYTVAAYDAAGNASAQSGPVTVNASDFSYPDRSQALTDPTRVAGIWEQDKEEDMVDTKTYPYKIPISEPGYSGDTNWIFEPGPAGSVKEQMYNSGGAQHIAGAQIVLDWMNMEPYEGQFDWSNFEKILGEWRAKGKKIWVEIRSSSQRDKQELGGRLKGAPDWIYTQPANPVPFIQARDPFTNAIITARYPVYWDPNFRMWWDRFMHEFAKEYNGDPTIAFVEIRGHAFGGEPGLSDGPDWQYVEDMWLQNGWDGLAAGSGSVVEGIYTDNVKDMALMFLDSFASENVNTAKYGGAATPTPIAYVAHFDSAWDNEVNAFMTSRHINIINNGFSGKLGSTSRTNMAERVANWGVPIGWVEWGPSGRQDKDGVAHSLQRVYEGAIGIQGSADPLSHVSHVPVSEYQASLDGTATDWANALAWANEWLRRDLCEGYACDN